MKNKIKLFFSKISLIEKLLLIFMFLFYIQIILNLFLNEENDGTNPIDTVTRTAVASIFGYFLGSNIEKSNVKKKQIGVSFYNNTRVIIVGIIGLMSLVVMLIIRNFDSIDANSIAGLSQMRDFVSATVGYLISIGKQKQ